MNAATEPSSKFRAAFDAGAAWSQATTSRVGHDEAVQQAWDAHGANGPRPSAEFPAVDPARDLPKAVELLRADAPNRHPYDALLYGMAADVLESDGLARWVDEQLAYAIRRRDEDEKRSVPGFHYWRGRTQALHSVRDRLRPCPTCATRPADLNTEQQAWRHHHCRDGCPGHWVHESNASPASCGGAS